MKSDDLTHLLCVPCFDSASLVPSRSYCFLKLRSRRPSPLHFLVHLLMVLALKKHIFTYWLERTFSCTSVGFLSIRLEESKEGVKKDPCLASAKSQMTPQHPLHGCIQCTCHRALTPHSVLARQAPQLLGSADWLRSIGRHFERSQLPAGGQGVWRFLL